LRFEVFGDDLVGCFSIEDALPPGVVGGVEAANQLLEIAVSVDRDAEDFTADPPVEAFDHAIVCGVWGACVAIFRA
jgi:hypothetical protein